MQGTIYISDRFLSVLFLSFPEKYSIITLGIQL